MPEFNPLPSDVRNRIETWLADNLHETDVLDSFPRNFGRKRSLFAASRSSLKKLFTKGLSPLAATKLSAMVGAIHEEPFANILNKWLELKGMEPVAVYKGAGVTKQVWAKLRNVAGGRKPNKDTALALSVGFKMTPEEADSFLASAGYAFSPSSRRDTIVRFFLANAEWDILSVNEALFDFGEKTLGEK